MKGHLAKNGSQVATNCYQLKFSDPDGRQHLSEVATAENLLHLVQSVPSPKAEPIKLWLARAGHEPMQELADPALAQDRARALWKSHGRSEKWVQERLSGQETRDKLIDYWAGQEFAILCNLIQEEWANLSIKPHKELKGLRTQNLWE